MLLLCIYRYTCIHKLIYYRLHYFIFHHIGGHASATTQTTTCASMFKVGEWGRNWKIPNRKNSVGYGRYFTCYMVILSKNQFSSFRHNYPIRILYDLLNSFRHNYNLANVRMWLFFYHPKCHSVGCRVNFISLGI